MWQLVKFELTKLFQKKIVWACCLGMLWMTVMMTLNWTTPMNDGVQYMEDGRLVMVEGPASMKANQEIAERWSGPLTDEKVQAVLEEYRWSREAMEEEGLEYGRQSYYIHNNLYSALRGGFAQLDGSWNGASVADVYDVEGGSLNVGYAEGWVNTIFGMIYTMLSLGCVIIVIISSLFADEYSRGTDALILSARYGKTKCAGAKIIAGFLSSMALTTAVLVIMLGTYVGTHGFAGWDAAIQLNSMEMFNSVPYVMTCGQAVLFAVLLWYAGIFILTACTMVFSAVAKNAFSSLVLSFAVYVIPMFINWGVQPFLRTVGNVFPINHMQLVSVFDYDKLNLGSVQINFMWLVVPVALILIIVSNVGAKKCFAHHQVTG